MRGRAVPRPRCARAHSPLPTISRPRPRAQKVTAAIVDTHQALALLSVPRGTDPPDAVVRPEELSIALTDWALQLLEGPEVMMPGTATKVLKDATREHRYVLQAAGFYGKLPWRVQW